MAQEAGSRKPRSNRSSWGTVAAIALAATVSRGLGCGGGPDDPDPTPGFEEADLLRSLGEGVLLPAYSAFLAAAQALETAAATWEQAEPGDDSDTARTAARQEWRTTMALWQQAEVYQVGPAGASVSVAGGLDLRDEIYSWPTVNPCRVDQELVEQGWDEPGWFADELVNVYGLDAVEYLLFYDGPDNACPPQVAINSDGSWDGLGAAEIDRRRAAYVRAASGHVVQIGSQLVTAWEPAGGDFLGQLSRAGEADSPYADQQEALNAIFDALFYVELFVKDRKLARPLGLRDCATTTCPGDLESQFADHSLENIRANLVAGRALLTGADTPDAMGFNDLLEYLDETALATDLVASLDAVIVAVDAVPGTALEAIDSDLPALEALYDALKEFTDLLKGEMAIVLLLEIPQEGAGDAD